MQYDGAAKAVKLLQDAADHLDEIQRKLKTAYDGTGDITIDPENFTEFEEIEVRINSALDEQKRRCEEWEQGTS